MTICRYALEYLKFDLDRFRIKWGLLPRSESGAWGMGRRAGIFNYQANPYIEGSALVRPKLIYGVNFVLDGPITISDCCKIEGPAKHWQLAHNQAIWDFHMASYYHSGQHQPAWSDPDILTPRT